MTAKITNPRRGDIEKMLTWIFCFHFSGCFTHSKTPDASDVLPLMHLPLSLSFFLLSVFTICFPCSSAYFHFRTSYSRLLFLVNIHSARVLFVCSLSLYLRSIYTCDWRHFFTLLSVSARDENCFSFPFG